MFVHGDANHLDNMGVIEVAHQTSFLEKVLSAFAVHLATQRLQSDLRHTFPARVFSLVNLKK